MISRYPDIGSKERSELRLLGFMQSGKLSALGIKARGCRTTAAVAKLWSSWLKRTPNEALNSTNRRLASFKRAATRFWRLKSEVRNFFLRELSNPEERKTLQAIELCCNGSEVVESFLINDFRAMAPFMLRGKRLSPFIRRAVADYLDNKGSRSWKTDDRRIVH